MSQLYCEAAEMYELHFSKDEVKDRTFCGMK